jgi:pimeloyl-ACP methyl ester carboxylesterase
MKLNKLPGSRWGLIAAVAGLLAGPAVAAESVAGSFDAHGVAIHYTVRGSGEPVVLVHGLLASGFLNWDLPGVTAAIAKDHRVITLDLPGHGASDKPEKAEAYGVQMVEDVVLLLDHLKIKTAHVVGYSLGGMITVKLLTTHPDRVLSATVGGMGWVREKGRNLGLRGPVRTGADSGALTYVVNGMGDLAVTRGELKAIKVPVEVIIGDQDPLNRATVAPLRAVRPDWPVVEIKNAGHMNCIIKKEFAEAIVAWLDKNRQK